MPSHRAVPARLLLLPLVGFIGASWAAPDRSAAVKAVALFKLSQFTSWPKPLAVGAAPSLCVIGRDEIADQFRALGDARDGVSDLKVLPVPDLDACRLAYVARSELARWPALFADLHRRQILTAADHGDQLADTGAVISLATEGGRVVFGIHHQRARDAQLTISAKVMRVSKQVFGQ
jgi:hypothetical protein